IFAAVTFTFPDEVNFKQRGLVLREETRQIRMKAGSCLVKLALSLADVLITLFDNFVQIIQKYIQDNQILQYERVKLIEFLLALIHYSSKPFPEKQRLFASIVESYVGEWEALDEVPFASPQALLGALGIVKLASNGGLSAEEINSIEEWRRKISLNVRTWMMWMKRTQGQPSLWPEYVFRILPKMLVFVRVIHSLGEPDIWIGIPAQYRVNLSVSDTEKDAILKKSSSKSDVLVDVSKTFIDGTAGWISNIRETCYSLIGTMTGFGPTLYTIPNLGNIILSSVFSSATHLDNRHWKSLISSVIRPLFMNCPAAAHGEVLDRIIPPFLEFIRARLDGEWKGVGEGRRGAGTSSANDEEEVSDEIVKEKILRELTRTHADLLVLIASPDEGKLGVKGQDLKVVEGSVYSHVISNEVIFGSIFGGLLHVMLLKDTISSRKAVVTILKTLPILAKTTNPGVLVFLGETVMKTCLEVFHDGYFQEVHNETISLMGEIYVALRAVNNPAAYQTLLALPGMSEAALQSFDAKFTAADKTKKERNVILRQFLRNIQGTSVSEAFKQFDGKAKAKPQLERNQKRRDVLDSSNDENAAVLDGFF
ncbi:hypothetical protein HDU98_005353, partial [Podochytrium sp. JEL0797]